MITLQHVDYAAFPSHYDANLAVLYHPHHAIEGSNDGEDGEGRQQVGEYLALMRANVLPYSGRTTQTCRSGDFATWSTGVSQRQWLERFVVCFV